MQQLLRGGGDARLLQWLLAAVRQVCRDLFVAWKLLLLHGVLCSCQAFRRTSRQPVCMIVSTLSYTSLESSESAAAMSVSGVLLCAVLSAQCGSQACCFQ